MLPYLLRVCTTNCRNPHVSAPPKLSDGDDYVMAFDEQSEGQFKLEFIWRVRVDKI